jgi:hypothetical protein
MAASLGEIQRTQEIVNRTEPHYIAVAASRDNYSIIDQDPHHLVVFIIAAHLFDIHAGSKWYNK